jgi:hypothetical protein
MEPMTLPLGLEIDDSDDDMVLEDKKSKRRFDAGAWVK